jgi:DNA-binding NarL/FixJ family response regulator
VVIIDEHTTVRRALEKRLQTCQDMEVVGCTGCWQEGIHMAEESAADVVLLETKRSDEQGMAALRRLRSECPYANVVVLTSYPDSDEREEALEAGATRYVLKDIGSDYLVQEIRDLAWPQAPI